jgi:hypothetical protein
VSVSEVIGDRKGIHMKGRIVGLCMGFALLSLLQIATICLSEVRSNNAHMMRHASATSDNLLVTEPLRFEPTSAGRAIKKGAEDVSFSDYKAQDGVRVSSREEHYRTRNDAGLAFEGLVKSASCVIERRPMIGGDSRKRTNRIVLRVGRSSGGDIMTIAWTDGLDLHVLESVSLRHVLEFETLVAIDHN